MTHSQRATSLPVPPEGLVDAFSLEDDLIHLEPIVLQPAKPVQQAAKLAEAEERLLAVGK